MFTNKLSAMLLHGKSINLSQAYAHICIQFLLRRVHRQIKLVKAGVATRIHRFPFTNGLNVKAPVVAVIADQCFKALWRQP